LTSSNPEDRWTPTGLRSRRNPPVRSLGTMIQQHMTHWMSGLDSLWGKRLWYVGFIPPNNYKTLNPCLPVATSPSPSHPTPSTQSSPGPYRRGRMRNRKQRLPTVDSTRTSTISSNRPARIPRSDGGHGNEPQSFFSDGESQGFRRSTDSRHSGTKSEGHVPRPARHPTRMRKAAAQSLSPPPSLSRRPLYHCIRNKASTSQSTFDCGVVPEIIPKRHITITPQQGASDLTWRSADAFPGSTDELGLPTPTPPIMCFSKNGFSLSGETEQRMNLARVVRDGQFVFHEGKPRKRDRIMQGLRRSFKSFFNLRVDE
jgi:hypothetical protein